MYQNVNWHNFQDAFNHMGRESQFSFDALRALFVYLTQVEEDLGEEFEFELDVIALCCEYREIEEDEEAYKEYIGDEAHLEDLIITTLPSSVLVRVG